MPTSTRPAQGDLFARRFDDGTLGKARRMVLERRREGVACPCCDQWCAVHRRRINRTQVALLRALIAAWRDGREGEYVHVSSILLDGRDARSSGGELAKLVYFGLIEAAPNITDPEKRASGRWRPTADGVAFADGRGTAPAWIELYNGKIVDVAIDVVHVDDARLRRPTARTTKGQRDDES